MDESSLASCQGMKRAAAASVSDSICHGLFPKHISLSLTEPGQNPVQPKAAIHPPPPRDSGGGFTKRKRLCTLCAPVVRRRLTVATYTERAAASNVKMDKKGLTSTHQGHVASSSVNNTPTDYTLFYHFMSGSDHNSHNRGSKVSKLRICEYLTLFHEINQIRFTG